MTVAGDNPFDSRRIERAEARVRELEDAALLLWAVLNVGQTKALRYDHPRLMDFMAHLHHSVEHEQAMVRQNVWAD